MRRDSGADRHRAGASGTLGALLALALLSGSACAPSLSTDRRLTRLIESRSAQLDPSTPAPARPLDRDAAERRRSASLDTDPMTTNPPASALRFVPAPIDRDVAARLESFADDLPDPELLYDEAIHGRSDENDLVREARLHGFEPARFADPEGVVQLDLPAVFRLSQLSAREFLTAEEEYLLAAIRLLIEQHRWSPRLFNDTSFSVSGADAEDKYRSAMRVINDLRVTQRLPFGGEAAARWVTEATEQLRATAAGRYRQSSEIVLSANVPLLRGAGQVAREDLIQAERDLVYAARTFEQFRRELLVNVARDYFQLLNTLAQIRNQERQLEGFLRTEARVRGWVESGRLRPFELNIVANQVLEARGNLETRREDYRLQLDRFKTRLGIPLSTPVVVRPFELAIPEPDVSLADASRAALDYRLDLQNLRDNVDDARRGVANARNRLLPDLNFFGEAGLGVFGTDGPTESIFQNPEYRAGFDASDFRYQAGVTFGLPLDREIERLGVRQSAITLERRERSYRQFRDNIIINSRASVRNVELARFRLELAERQVLINQRRLEEQELRADQVTAQQIVDTEAALLNAENQRDQARTDLRNAVLNYLLQTGQLRVARDGDFEPLPGMERGEPAGETDQDEDPPEDPPPGT